MEVCTDTKRSFFSRRKFLRYIDRGALHGQTLNDAITCDCTRACMAGQPARGVVRVRLRVCKYRAQRKEWLVLCPIIKKMKWKNHFYEMKGDVGMSLHEKGRNKKMPTPRHKVTHNPIPTSLFLPRPQHNIFRRQLDVKMFCCLLCLMHS